MDALDRQIERFSRVTVTAAHGRGYCRIATTSSTGELRDLRLCGRALDDALHRHVGDATCVGDLSQRRARAMCLPDRSIPLARRHVDVLRRVAHELQEVGLLGSAPVVVVMVVLSVVGPIEDELTHEPGFLGPRFRGSACPRGPRGTPRVQTLTIGAYSNATSAPRAVRATKTTTASNSQRNTRSGPRARLRGPPTGWSCRRRAERCRCSQSARMSSVTARTVSARRTPSRRWRAEGSPPAGGAPDAEQRNAHSDHEARADHETTPPRP